MLLTAAVVLTVNYGLESFVHANMKEIFACEILAVALICAAGLCCTLRLGTSWPCCVIYLIVPSVSFGVIFGVISVVYADADSFLVRLINSFHGFLEKFPLGHHNHSSFYLRWQLDLHAASFSLPTLPLPGSPLANIMSIQMAGYSGNYICQSMLDHSPIGEPLTLLALKNVAVKGHSKGR